MHKIHYTRTIIITTLIPVFSTLAMENASSNSNREKSSTDTNSQQVSNAQQSARTLMENASRYVWKKYTEEGKRGIIGLGDEKEKATTIAIYAAAKQNLGNGKTDDTLTNQFFERQKVTQETVLTLLKKFSETDYIPQDIKDGVALCLLPNIDAVLTRDLLSKLQDKNVEAIQNMTDQLTKMRNDIIATKNNSANVDEDTKKQ